MGMNDTQQSRSLPAQSSVFGGTAARDVRLGSKAGGITIFVSSIHRAICRVHEVHEVGDKPILRHNFYLRLVATIG